MNDTVIYRHIKPCGEVFYVGIGNEKRPYNKKHRSDFWKRVVKKYPDYEVQVLKSDLSWEEACELEKILIAYYGRKDLGLGTLVNMTNGGEGSNGRVCTEKSRKKIRAARKGIKHSKETLQKLSSVKSGENNPMYGKNHSAETKRKISAAQRGEKHHMYGKKLSKEHRQKIAAAKSGKNHPMYGKPALNRKLTFEQAQEIRHRYQTEKTSHRKLAKEYGVSKDTIGNIINNKLYTK